MNPKWVAIADRRRRARPRFVGERQDHVRRRAHDLHGSLRTGKLGWAHVPGHDGRRRQVPVQGERQQAGSAATGSWDRRSRPASSAAASVKDRGNWSCEESAGQPPTIARAMMNGRPRREDDETAHSVSRRAKVGVVGARRRHFTSTAKPGTRNLERIRHVARTGAAAKSIAARHPEPSAARIAALADAPMRFAPASIIARTSARLRMPPDALTPTAGPTAARISRTSADRGAAGRMKAGGGLDERRACRQRQSARERASRRRSMPRFRGSP